MRDAVGERGRAAFGQGAVLPQPGMRFAQRIGENTGAVRMVGGEMPLEAAAAGPGVDAVARGGHRAAAGEFALVTVAAGGDDDTVADRRVMREAAFAAPALVGEDAVAGAQPG